MLLKKHTLFLLVLQIIGNKKIITVDTTKPITKIRIVHIWGNSLHFEILDHNNFFHNDSSLLYSGFK